MEDWSGIDVQWEIAVKRERLRGAEAELRSLAGVPGPEALERVAVLSRKVTDLRALLRTLDAHRLRPSSDGRPYVDNQTDPVDSLRFLVEQAERYDLSRLHVTLVQVADIVPGPVDGHWRRPPAGLRSGLYSIVCAVDAGVTYPTPIMPDLGPPGSVDRRRERSCSRYVNDAEKAAVTVLSHELFHFQRHTRQVGWRNCERNANQFAWECVLRFREWRTAH